MATRKEIPDVFYDEGALEPRLEDLDASHYYEAEKQGFFGIPFDEARPSFSGMEQKEVNKQFLPLDVSKFNVAMAFKTVADLKEEVKDWKVKLGERVGVDLTYMHAEIILCVPCSGQEHNCPCNFVYRQQEEDDALLSPGRVPKPRKHVHQPQTVHYVSVRVLEDKNSLDGCMFVSMARSFSSNTAGGVWHFAFKRVEPGQVIAAIHIVRSQLRCRYNMLGMWTSFAPALSCVLCAPGALCESSKGYLQSRTGFMPQEEQDEYNCIEGVLVPAHYFSYHSKWFCSEFVMALLLSCAMLDMQHLHREPLDPWRYTPSKLATLIKRDRSWLFSEDWFGLKQLKKAHKKGSDLV